MKVENLINFNNINISGCNVIEDITRTNLSS